MKKIIMALLAVSMVVLPLSMPVSADNCNCSQVQKGTLSISYSAEKQVSPDVVEFSIAIKTSDKKSMQEASRKNKEISNSVYEYLKTNITPANGDYIKTSNYNASPVYTYNNGKRNFDRYEVSNNIIVHTKSFDKISSMIDKSISLGATNVDSLNFSLSNKDGACEELLSKAGKQARKRADIVAASVGTSITGVKDVNTSCSFNQRNVNYGYRNMMLMKASASDAVGASEPSTNIEVGNMTIYANVDATFFVK